MKYDYDLVIVGGGPGGATTALYAERLGLKTLVVDKKHFPRDKICGDAISGKSVLYLEELGLIDELEANLQVRVNSVIFGAPNNVAANISITPRNFDGELKGYVCRRMVYDNILFQAAKQKVETIEGFTVQDVIKPNGQVLGIRGTTEQGEDREITAKIVIGADGSNSIVARKLDLYDHDMDHVLVATRAYYRGVKGMTDAIELHYRKEIMPGYFWIFPLENGMTNVGLGMVKSELKKRNIKLRDAHVAATETWGFRERFADAELIGGIQGWNLPCGSKRRTVHGDGFILIGDAAGLIDPFTGEGIGNAMCSGKVAAEIFAEVCRGNDYSARATAAYTSTLWKRLGGELSLSYNLQRLTRFVPLVNLVVNRAAKRPEVSDWISGMMADTISKRELLKPQTYFKLLFK